MHEPYAALPEPPAARSRTGLFVFVAMFLAAFVAVGGLLLVRAGGGPGEPDLAGALRTPPGYTRLPDGTAGAGRLSEGQAAGLLRVADVPGFQDGLLRAWGRRPGEPPRAVVVLVVDVETPAQADALRDGYARRSGGTPFATPPDLRATGFREPPDRAGRVAQRVVFSRADRVFVVSVVTPERDEDTAEVVRLATDQAAAATPD